jgi:hypothetical protein
VVSYDDVDNIARLCKRFGLHDAVETPDKSKQMDLQKQVTISPTGRSTSSPSNHIDRPKKLSLFEAVRVWANDEGIPFDIVDAGNRLTKALNRSVAFDPKTAFVKRRRSGTICPAQRFNPMRPLWIRMVLLLVGALLSSVSVTCAQVIEPDRATVPALRHPALPDFSMQQRAAIYKSIIAAMKEHPTVAVPSDTQVDVGTTLPETELLQSPEDMRVQIAAANKYKYAIWNDQVLVVDPAKKTVVDILHDYILRAYDKQK